jgi:hypothetical protein
MHNVTHEVKGDKLIITVDVSATTCEAAGMSSTGKTKQVATSSGQMPITSPKGWSIGFSLNVNAKKQ